MLESRRALKSIRKIDVQGACSVSSWPRASLTHASSKSMRGHRPCDRSNISWRWLSLVPDGHLSKSTMRPHSLTPMANGPIRQERAKSTALCPSYQPGREIKIQRDALFQRLQKADEVADLAGIQPKLRHPWVARRQPFAECVLQRFDRISLVKSSKWRRGGARASGRSVDRMTPRTIGLREGLSAADAFHVGKCRKARDDVENNQY